MADRRYQHYCPVARAMEQLGGRWTILILRELATGPKRYSDLMNRLHGVGTNLLAERIHELQDSGLVVRQTLPMPASSKVYVLTELGEQTLPLLRALAQFGNHFLNPGTGALYRPIWLAESLLARMAAEAAPPDDDTEFRVDDEVFHLTWHQSEPRITLGAAHRPALVINTGRAGLEALTHGQVKPDLQWSGDADAWARFLTAFNIRNHEAAA